MIAKEYLNKNREYIIANGGNHLFELKKVNIFVGANNSGKSRFLRQVFNGKSEDFQFYDIKENIADIYKALVIKFHEDSIVTTNLKELFNLNEGDFIKRFNAFFKILNDSNSRNLNEACLAIKKEMQRLNIFKDLNINLEEKRRPIYIPILRGLRRLNSIKDVNNTDDIYVTRTNEDYNLGKDMPQIRETFSGLNIYSEIKRMLLGSQKEREFIREFEAFLSSSFFQGKTLTLIPDFEEAVLKINIKGEDDRKIFDVGDGIQAIIISTFKAFKHQEDNLVLFIEEPEMMMHPSVQRVLIETLTMKFPKMQVFLTTHSNHFLDLASEHPTEVAIFSFEKNDGKFNIRNVSGNSKILDLLGVRNSSVFLSNCIIWTEGVTDRMLLRKLLAINGCVLKEDFHYSFAEYGGSNLENFDFNENEDSNGVTVKAISKTNFLIADNDNIKGEDNNSRESLIFKRREKIKSILGKDNFFDEHLEIENLIPYKVWRQVIESILKDKPGKGISLKPMTEIVVEKFDKELNEKKIGKLLKEYLIEPKGKKFDYYDEDNIKCLGLTKKEVMEYAINGSSIIFFNKFFITYCSFAT